MWLAFTWKLYPVIDIFVPLFNRSGGASQLNRKGNNIRMNKRKTKPCITYPEIIGTVVITASKPTVSVVVDTVLATAENSRVLFKHAQPWLFHETKQYTLIYKA